MRTLRIVVGIWLLCMLALWIRDGRGFCVLDALPFVERNESFSSDYEWLALAALGIGLWGCLTLARRMRGRRNRQGSRFRSEIILVPAAIIAMALITMRVTPALSFVEVIGHSPRQLEHVYLAVLCVGVFAVVLAMKWFGRS